MSRLTRAARTDGAFDWLRAGGFIAVWLITLVCLAVLS